MGCMGIGWTGGEKGSCENEKPLQDFNRISLKGVLQREKTFSCLQFRSKDV